MLIMQRDAMYLNPHFMSLSFCFKFTWAHSLDFTVGFNSGFTATTTLYMSLAMACDGLLVVLLGDADSLSDKI